MNARGCMDKVVMVSGGNRGIGKAIVDRLVKEGYQLSVGVRDPATMADFDGLVCRYDALNSVDAKNWVNETIARYGRIDGLVNNAGAVDKVTFNAYQDEDDAALEAMWRVNSLGVLKLSQLCHPYLYESDIGRIVHLSSLSGKRVGPVGKNMGYAMSKFSLMAISDAINLEGKGDIKGVRSTAICPGQVSVDRNKTFLYSEFPMHPNDIADTVNYLLSLSKRVVISEICLSCC